MMDEKLKETVKNVLTIGGAIAIAYALLDEVTDVTDFEKLTSGANAKPMPLLESGKKKPEESEMEEDHERETERKKHSDEVAELKRKLAEAEGKSGEHKIEE